MSSESLKTFRFNPHFLLSWHMREIWVTFVDKKKYRLSWYKTRSDEKKTLIPRRLPCCSFNTKILGLKYNLAWQWVPEPHVGSERNDGDGQGSCRRGRGRGEGVVGGGASGPLGLDGARRPACEAPWVKVRGGGRGIPVLRFAKRGEMDNWCKANGNDQPWAPSGSCESLEKHVATEFW